MTAFRRTILVVLLLAVSLGGASPGLAQGEPIEGVGQLLLVPSVTTPGLAPFDIVVRASLGSVTGMGCAGREPVSLGSYLIPFEFDPSGLELLSVTPCAETPVSLSSLTYTNLDSANGFGTFAVSASGGSSTPSSVCLFNLRMRLDCQAAGRTNASLRMRSNTRGALELTSALVTCDGTPRRPAALPLAATDLVVSFFNQYGFPPSINFLDPIGVPVTGGTVTAHGCGLAGSRVRLGPTEVPVLTSSDTALTFTAPPHAAGPVDVAVIRSTFPFDGDTRPGGLTYYTPQGFFTVDPCRLLDTRGPAGPLGGPALASGTPRSFQVAGGCGVPADATSAVVNVTVTNATARGFLAIRASGTDPTETSTINFVPGVDRANNALVSLAGVPGGVTVQPFLETPGSVDLILDVNGYFGFGPFMQEIELRDTETGAVLRPSYILGWYGATSGRSLTFVTLRGALPITWDFGDGTTSSLPTVTHTYTVSEPKLLQARMLSAGFPRILDIFVSPPQP